MMATASITLILSMGAIIVAGLALGWAMMRDYQSYVLPNKASLAIIFSFLLYAGLNFTIPVFLSALGIAALCFLMTFGLFMTGQFGAGDVKLLSALALWAGPSLIMPLVMITALAGGFLATFFIIGGHLSRARLCSSNPDSPICHKSVQPVQKLPYGLAIGFAGLYVLAQHAFALMA